MAVKFFLLTETSFHASYLVTEWIRCFGAIPEFMGIAMRAGREPERIRSLRESLHQEFQGQHCLPNTILQGFRKVYPGLSETDLAMIKLFGVPAHSVTFYPDTTFLGTNLNHQCAWQWLSESSQEASPFLFIFLDQLLASWWIESTHSQIINGHSAVLPYARGMYAIENIAIRQDIDDFRKAAGATIHYIDTGIDTGPIIKTENLADPFCFDSIWEMKAASFHKAFSLLTQASFDLLEKQQRPIGLPTDPKLHGPNFKSWDFTDEARREAEKGYMKMKMTEQHLLIF